MKKTLSIALFSLLTLATAQKTQTVYINGQPVQAVSVNVGGKPALQILTSDLQKTGALTQGGSKPVDAIQGCKGQTLFNGVLRVTLVDAGLKDGHYQVTFKIANGTNKEINPASNEFSYEDIWAADDNGKAQYFSNWDEKNSPNNSLLPGSNLTTTFKTNAPAFTPTRILWRIDDKSINRDLPWAKVKNMEFKLQCK